MLILLVIGLLCLLAASILMNVFQYTELCKALSTKYYLEDQLRKLETPIQSLYQD